MEFTLSFVDNSMVSVGNNPSDPAYNPIYLLLDSTDESPAPSEPVELNLMLPAGYYCDSAVITFRGTTAPYWEITSRDPSEAAWGNTATVAIVNNQPTKIWVRAKTFFEEVPVDDRSTSIRILGEARRVI